MQLRSLLVLGATLVLFAGGCRQEDETCRTLTELCPMPNNYETCRQTLERLDGREARKRHDCVMSTKSCPKAAACVNGVKDSWDIYQPYSAQSAR